MSIDGMVKNGVAALAVSGVLLATSAGYNPARAENPLERFGSFLGEVVMTAAELPVGVYNALNSGDVLDMTRIPARMTGRILTGAGHVLNEDIKYNHAVGEDNAFSDSDVWNYAGVGLAAAAVLPVVGLAAGGLVGAGTGFVSDNYE